MLHDVIEQFGLKASLQLIERRAVIQQHDVSTRCNHITQPLQLYAFYARTGNGSDRQKTQNQFTIFMIKK